MLPAAEQVVTIYEPIGAADVIRDSDWLKGKGAHGSTVVQTPSSRSLGTIDSIVSWVGSYHIEDDLLVISCLPSSPFHWYIKQSLNIKPSSWPGVTQRRLFCFFFWQISEFELVILGFLEISARTFSQLISHFAEVAGIA